MLLGRQFLISAILQLICLHFLCCSEKHVALYPHATFLDKEASGEETSIKSYYPT